MDSRWPNPLTETWTWKYKATATDTASSTTVTRENFDDKAKAVKCAIKDLVKKMEEKKLFRNTTNTAQTVVLRFVENVQHAGWFDFIDRAVATVNAAPPQVRRFWDFIWD